MIRFSTGLRNALAGEYGLGIMMNGGVMRVYGETMPASPDIAPGTPILGTITTEGRPFVPVYDTHDAGLLLQIVTPGALTNSGNWSLVGIAFGEATWFRWHWKWEDDLLDGTYYPRIDGDIGLLASNSALRLTSRTVTPSTNRSIEQFFMQIPMEGG